MTRIIRSICLPPRVERHIKKNVEIKNFSSWVAEKYEEEFLNIEARAKELERTTKLRKKIKDEIRELKKQKREFLSTLPRQSRSWLKNEGPDRLKKIKSGHVNFEGVYMFFVNNFDLRDQVNRRQFKILIGMEGKNDDDRD